MTHTVTPESPKTIVQSVSEAKVTLNAQVSGFSGHPNPTLLSLMSTGAVSLSKMANGVSLNGNFGGE